MSGAALRNSFGNTPSPRAALIAIAGIKRNELGRYRHIVFADDARFFLMLYSAARFIQNKKFFSFIPKAIVETVRPKEERFKGQHVLG